MILLLGNIDRTDCHRQWIPAKIVVAETSLNETSFEQARFFEIFQCGLFCFLC